MHSAMTAAHRVATICSAVAVFSAHSAGAQLVDDARPVRPGPHRIGLSSGAGATLNGAGEHPQEGRGLGLRAVYGYRVVRGLELRAGLSYWKTETVVTDILFGAIELRPYLPLGADDQAELGLAFRFGYCAMIYPDAPEADHGRSDRVWSGTGVSLGPDFHYWFSPSLGLIVAADLSAGGGADHSDEPGPYLPKRAGFAALTGWLGVVVAL